MSKKIQDAVNLIRSRNGTPRADDWELAEAAKTLAGYFDIFNPLPISRDRLGRMVRETWLRWAKEQPDPKPSWLLPYDELAERDQEVDRMIGEDICRATLAEVAAVHSGAATP